MQPGPAYDETTYECGTVHMLTSRGAPSFTHSPYGWVHTARRSWPLMVVPYAGAINNYLYLPAFALFGPGLRVSRAVHALLAVLGVLGVGLLVSRAAGALAGGAAALALAIHPGYLSNVLFNNGGIAQLMGLIGCACIALRGYLARPTAAWAAALGLFCGAGVWARLNFAWLVAAAALGALLAFGRRALPPLRHAGAMVAGALAGSAPLIWYQLRSGGRDTLAFMAGRSGAPRDADVFLLRIRQLISSLVYDSEHRVFVWGGPLLLPFWQMVFTAALVLAALALAFQGREDEDVRRWHRASAIAILALAAVMMGTRLPVREHHLMTLVPLVVVCVVLAARRWRARFAAARPVIVAVAALYAGIALSWDVSALRGLSRTGGVGPWSSVVADVARYLDAQRPPRVAYLDWGYHNSIYTITNGRVDARELFWYDSGSPYAPVWREEIAPGGVYITHGPRYLLPIGRPSTERFWQELSRSGLQYSRLSFNDARGETHTELIEVRPSP